MTIHIWMWWQKCHRNRLTPKRYLNNRNLHGQRVNNYFNMNHCNIWNNKKCNVSWLRLLTELTVDIRECPNMSALYQQPLRPLRYYTGIVQNMDKILKIHTIKVNGDHVDTSSTFQIKWVGEIFSFKLIATFDRVKRIIHNWK